MALTEQPMSKCVLARAVGITLKADSTAGLVCINSEGTIVFKLDLNGNMEFTGALVESADEV